MKILAYSLTNKTYNSHGTAFSGKVPKVKSVKNAKEAVQEDGTIFLSADKENSQVVIRCTDNGCGIPDDELDRIFEPFYSLKETGTGLGLSLSKRIVEAHGGKITASSSRKTGTVFTVTLPI